jgi:hypothetical protein
MVSICERLINVVRFDKPKVLSATLTGLSQKARSGYTGCAAPVSWAPTLPAKRAHLIHPWLCRRNTVSP